MLRQLTRLIFLYFALISLQPANAEMTDSIKIETGLITGVAHDGVEVFRGIPYAAPPVGILRWRAPQPAAAWSGIRAADRFGDICVQPPRPGIVEISQAVENMSEDCLVLNVFTPKESDGPMPVMVWIHGGGFTRGASSLPQLNGEAFARGGVVLVSINYRLGRLGVFAHPALTAENADDGRLANYGLMDQIAALKWVARNISTFGGDPENVTIFGESAGGLSVNALMVSPEARGLFHRAISQSGYGRGWFNRMTVDTPDGRRAAETEGVELAAAVGVKGNDLAALRAVPAEAIVQPRDEDGYIYFVLDGKVLTDDMWAAFRDNKEAPVPFMLGSNSHEFPGTPWNDLRPDVRYFIADNNFDKLSKAYGGPKALDDNLMSDFLFTQQARALARMHRDNGHPTFLYLYSVVDDAEAAEGKGAPHAAEIPYVFDTLSTVNTDLLKADKTVARTMNATWRAFATYGEPNGKGLTPWPDYSNGQIMEYMLHGQAVHPDTRNKRLNVLSSIVDDRS
jgi:para-nitrobenzyl esterase